MSTMTLTDSTGAVRTLTLDQWYAERGRPKTIYHGHQDPTGSRLRGRRKSTDPARRRALRTCRFCPRSFTWGPSLAIHEKTCAK